MKSLFIIVVIVGTFKSNESCNKNFIVKEVKTSRIDTIVWLKDGMNIGDTVGFEAESYLNSRYGKKYFEFSR